MGEITQIDQFGAPVRLVQAPPRCTGPGRSSGRSAAGNRLRLVQVLSAEHVAEQRTVMRRGVHGPGAWARRSHYASRTEGL